MIGGGWPRTSAAVQPNTRSAAGFQATVVRSAPKAMIGSAAEASTAHAVAEPGSGPPPPNLRPTHSLRPRGVGPRSPAPAHRPEFFPADNGSYIGVRVAVRHQPADDVAEIL